MTSGRLFLRANARRGVLAGLVLTLLQSACTQEESRIGVEDEDSSFDSDGAFIQTILRVNSTLATPGHTHDQKRPHKAVPWSALQELRHKSIDEQHGVEEAWKAIQIERSEFLYDFNHSHHWPVHMRRSRNASEVCDARNAGPMYVPPTLSRDMELWHITGYAYVAASCYKPQIADSFIPARYSRLFRTYGQAAPANPKRSKVPESAYILSAAYFTVFVLVIGWLLLNMLSALLAADKEFSSLKRKPKQEKESRPALETWNYSLISWIYASWATPWIATWGNARNSDLTTIKSGDIGPLQNQEDDCGPSYERFKTLWEEEIRKVGSNRANLVRVSFRLIGFRRVFAQFFWVLFFESSFYFAVPFTMGYVGNFLNWYYAKQHRGEAVDPADVLHGASVFILCFTALTMLAGMASNVSKFINARICVNLAGALSMAVFDKGLRLPVSMETTDIHEEGGNYTGIGDVIAEAMSDGRESVAADSTDASPESSPECEGDGQKRSKDGSGSKAQAAKPATVRYPMVQLILNDINTNIIWVQFGLVRSLVLIPILMLLFIWLCILLGWAAIVCAVVTVALCYLIVHTGVALGFACGYLFYHQGRRVETLQQCLFGIRYVKSCGQEGLMQSTLQELREEEYAPLNSYYQSLGIIWTTFSSLPKVVFAFSMSFYIWIYGGISATHLIVIIPLVGQFNICMAALLEVVPTLGAAVPSFQRVQNYLRQPDGPGLHVRDDSDTLSGASNIPPYVKLWPPFTGKSDDLPLSLKGDFGWYATGEPILKNLDITIPRGSLVAVVGSVGSGKSSLIHCMLGELYPHAKAELQRPARIAYSAQMANIVEGSLKDNVTFGYDYNQERFREAIYTSCLIPDLEMLPGGEDVPIGARGITLSGGQKARISMARAAYSMGTDVVLLDDPFAAVDTHTSAFIGDNYLRSTLMEGRTRVVVCQPERSLLMRFDRILVLESGEIKEQGAPETVMQTEAFKLLLSTFQEMQLKQGGSAEKKGQLSPDRESRTASEAAKSAAALRDEEFQGRASWSTFRYFLREGGVWTWIFCFFFGAAFKFFDTALSFAAALWMNAVSNYDNGLGPAAKDWNYMFLFYSLTLGFIGTQAYHWSLQLRFTHNMSRACYNHIIESLLRAPIDRFFDRTPVGRILNRVTTDLTQVDMTAVCKIMGSFVFLVGMLLPILVVHIMIPWWFTLASCPIYYLLILITRKYWNTMMPMRYLTSVVKSSVDEQLSEIENSNVSTRAYGKSLERMSAFEAVMNDHIKCDFSSLAVLERWLLIRYYTCGAGMLTSVALLTMLAPSRWTLGTATLVIMQMYQVVINFEWVMMSGCSCQYEFIAMNRVHDYTDLPSEKAAVLPGDFRFSNLNIKVGARSELGSLNFVGSASPQLVGESGSGIKIYRDTYIGREMLLEQVPNKAAFQAVPGKTFADLGIRGDYQFDLGHQLVAVNGVRGSADAIATELCKFTQPQAPVTLQMACGWMSGGAQVEIEDLVAGYGDWARNVLHGINIFIPKKAKAGIVGTTGSGKSSMLQCILRIIEPRSGQIKINSVDTSTLGVQTLRAAIGLVPQDPTLIGGTLRSNVDILGEYSDESIWQALEDTQMAEYVKQQDGQLDMKISADGGNLSFGQRQLVCIARMALRQPSLLLLDEATCAIDPATQEVVQKTLETRFPNSTMIVIAHRLETIMNFDLVVVLEGGRVVEKGPVQVLKNQPGSIFAGMLAATRS